jgi:hypothetical protein
LVYVVIPILVLIGVLVGVKVSPEISLEHQEERARNGRVEHGQAQLAGQFSSTEG